jgi:hypothetical protein
VIATPEGQLAHGMRQVNGLYTQYDNRGMARQAMCSKGDTRRSWWSETVTS